jgi:long-subunit fatty acid transport protein
MRWISTGYRNRFRYRVGASYPFRFGNNTPKIFQASFSNELFFTASEPYFERNRFQVGLSYKITKATILQVGYLHQFDYSIYDEIGRDFMVLGYFIEISKKGMKGSNSESVFKEN